MRVKTRHSSTNESGEHCLGKLTVFLQPLLLSSQSQAQEGDEAVETFVDPVDKLARALPELERTLPGELGLLPPRLLVNLTAKESEILPDDSFPVSDTGTFITLGLSRAGQTAVHLMFDGLQLLGSSQDFAQFPVASQPVLLLTVLRAVLEHFTAGALLQLQLEAGGAGAGVDRPAVHLLAEDHRHLADTVRTVQLTRGLRHLPALQTEDQTGGEREVRIFVNIPAVVILC